MLTAAVNMQDFYYNTILLRNQNWMQGLILQDAAENTHL